MWNVWPEVRQLDEHVQQAMERVPNATMNPRFGSHGWFQAPPLIRYCFAAYRPANLQQ